jgi:DNA replication protein DnaC
MTSFRDPKVPHGDYFMLPVWWPELLNELRDGKAYERVSDMAKKWPLLVLDEIGASRDTTGYAGEQLYTLLARREKKWTVITTNLSMQELGVLDNRIASRCFRNDGIVVETNTVDFNQRPK